MNEEKIPEKISSPEYLAFLQAVERNGAYVRVLEETNGKKEIKNYNIKKGSKNHTITDENLIGFRPLNRKEQRAIFHTPYKHNRRIKA